MVLTAFGKLLKGKANEKKKTKKNGNTTATDDEDDILLKTFRKFDKDNSGALDEAEMLKAMQDIVGTKATIPMVKHVMMMIDTDKNGTIELEEFYDFFEKVDDMIKNNFGGEVAATTGSAECDQGAVSTSGNQSAAATSQDSTGISQEAFNDLLAKVTEMEAAHKETMAKMQAEFKAEIQALQEEQKAEIKTLQEKHQSQTDMLQKEVQELKSELVEVKSITTAIKEKEEKKKDKKAKKGEPQEEELA
jgi:hypothetical protein